MSKNVTFQAYALVLRRVGLLLFLIIYIGVDVCAQSTNWVIEAESAQSRVLQRGDTLDITSPKGLSLWWAHPMTAPCSISYRACVVVGGGPYDRLSDLNCFWMASLADGSSPLRGITQRSGRFVESYRLQCYYLGYGGNYNSTTRFRRYTADTLAVADETRRPPVLREYLDSAHLLQPNHWYDVRIEVEADGHTCYYIDNQLLVDYLDQQPLRRGWFAFRTTWSHTRITVFQYKQR